MLKSLDGRAARFALLVAALLVLAPASAWAEDPVAPTPADPAKEEESATEEKVEASTVHWERDYEKAKAKAAAEGKDLLINFTGSDWCHWCIKLEEEVFSKGDFGTKAEEKFVFVFLDFPRSEALKAKIVDPQVNKALQKSFGVRGFPTIMLTTADGTPWARTGYEQGGPDNYLKHLDKLRESGAHIKTLAASREKLTVDQLKQGIEALAGNGLLGNPSFEWIYGKARTLDPEGTHGLRIHADRHDEQNAFQALIPKGPGQQPDWAAIYEFVKKAKHLEDYPPFVGASYQVVGAYLKPAKRFDEAIALAERVKNMQLLEHRDDVRTQIEEAIELLKKEKADAETETGEGEMEDHDETEDGHKKEDGDK